MSDPVVLLDDLRDESDELDRLVADLSEEEWAAPTPAPGWTVAHQIAHLAWTDRAALLAATDAEAFAAETRKALAAPERFVDEGTEESAGLPPAKLLAHWRTGRARLQEALRAAPPGTRFPWYGPPMSAPAMATARLMETWAHGQDVADALGVVRVPTARLRHVAWIGHRARDYAFLVRGLPLPEGPVRVEITGPGGEPWGYGPEDAADRVTGPALDFCLLVTQRVHRADTALTAHGTDADRWLDIAQAFAGPAGEGREKGEARRDGVPDPYGVLDPDPYGDLERPAPPGPDPYRDPERPAPPGPDPYGKPEEA
nr:MULTISPECIES: TIGR03084 family metal-binding protein [unclassified Streptomyces]